MENALNSDGNWKNSKKFRFLTCFCSFCQIFDKLAGLECSRSSTRNEFDVRDVCMKKSTVFVQKRFKLRPKLTKVPKFINISRFYITLVNFSKDFVDQNVENFQQRMYLLSNRVVRVVNCCFVRKKPHWPKTQKLLIFFNFWFSNPIFVKFSTFPRIRTLAPFNNNNWFYVQKAFEGDRCSF